MTNGRMGTGAGETERPFAAKRLPSETWIELKSKSNHMEGIGLESHRRRLGSNMTQRLWGRTWPS
jgi:hypothetical protein